MLVETAQHILEILYCLIDLVYLLLSLLDNHSCIGLIVGKKAHAVQRRGLVS